MKRGLILEGGAMRGVVTISPDKLCEVYEIGRKTAESRIDDIVHFFC